MRKLMTATLVAGFGLMGMTAPAMAATTGAQRFLVIFGADPHGPARVIATGPISGQGTATTASSHENANGTHTDTEAVVFPKGHFTILDTGRDTMTFDPRSCHGTFTEKGTLLITGGTGAYAGVKGTATFVAQATFVVGRLPDGSCQPQSSNKPPLAFSGLVKVSGTVTLP